ncbi:MAG: ribbon-helix-helix domain-containing protein [Actinomycetota bacterium]|nr:ribbon-helix-helix domain-containing protein [Actinomycetota bacterium]
MALCITLRIAANGISVATESRRAHRTTGGTICHIIKTTVYLPEDLKYALSRVAQARGQSEAEVIRVALQSLVEAEPQLRPRGGIIKGDQITDVANTDEEYLKRSRTRRGFGEW